ncbi:unnamed protein product [Phaeothamnion confervicola]
MPETSYTRLDNGVRVASEATAGELATVAVFVDSGSRYESSAINGVSALVKEAAFLGKEAEIAKLGGSFSATAGREQTVLKATVLKADVSKALEILAGAAKGTAISEAAVEKAKGAALCALEGAANSPETAIFDHLHDTAFLDTPLGMSPLGTPETVSRLRADDVSAFVRANFTAPRVVVAAAGAVDHMAVADAAAKLLGGLPSVPEGSMEALMEPGIFTGSDIRMRFDSMDSAHIAFGFQGAAATSPHTLPLQLLQTIIGAYDERSSLGANAASVWASEAAKHGLARFATAFNLSYKDTGVFGMYSVNPDNKLDDYMWYTLDSLVRLCHEISDDEVAIAKNQFKTNLLLQTAGGEATALDIGKQMLSYGRKVTAAEMFSRIDALTTADLKKTASTFINDQDHALAAIGTIHELPDYNWIRRRSYWCVPLFVRRVDWILRLMTYCPSFFAFGPSRQQFVENAS